MLNKSALLPVLFSFPCMKATLGSSSPLLDAVGVVCTDGQGKVWFSLS